MLKIIQKEVQEYEEQSMEIVPGFNFSAYKLIRRIILYKNEVYPKGKFDSQGNYKYFFNIIAPRVQSEIKNIDFDTKDIVLWSDAKDDAIRILLANVAMKQWLKDSGQAEKLNEAVEIGTEFGNVVWKKVAKEYIVVQLFNFMVLNQSAKTLEDSDVIEYAVMTSADLRKKIDTWENVEELIKSARVDKAPEFHIYERNGEISEKEYYEAKDESGGKEDKYILCKVIVGGTDKAKPTQILFCDEISEKPYKEYHRSSFSGRWFRVGLYEILMDIQTRANEIGNQIARGLEWSAKTVFRSSDRLIVQNILTDMNNGDIIKSTDLQQVNTRMEGLDQLIADWNRLMELADKLSNSYEVVTGESSPSGTPFRLAAQQNMNANKLFDYIREKLGIALQGVLEDWILPNMLKSLNKQEILQLTADSGMLPRYLQAVVDDWYIQNLAFFPPHDDRQAQEIKQEKLQELMQTKEVNVEMEKEMWKNFAPRCRVNIVGENYALVSELETLTSFITLEQDPIRRTALIEMAMLKKNIDIGSLPKTPPQPVMQPDQEGAGLDKKLQTMTQ